MKRLASFLILAFVAFSLQAAIKLPALIGSNMVLQRNATPNIWGKADPQSKVTVTTSWNKQMYSVTADKDGHWLVKVKTPDAGGPYSITIREKETIVLKNVLIGEVWISSGQSNMEMPVRGFSYQPNENCVQTIMEAPQYQGIRMFTVQKTSVDTPLDTCKGDWKLSTPESVGSFSATAYYFAKNLNKVLNIPIGIITSNWGGSAIEAWMTQESLNAIDGLNMPLISARTANNQKVAVLYNGMIAPINNYTAKGFIWYQGETNRDNYQDYAKLMQGMLKLWRADWKDEKMPFYYAQLAPYTYEGVNGYSLAVMWEQQFKALKMIPYSGMATTTDLGDASCIHPARKEMVGMRLAMIALQNDYAIKGLPSSSTYCESVEYKDGKAIVKVNSLGEGGDINTLNAINQKIDGFEVAGADQKFYPAQGGIVWGQGKIELKSESVASPVAVRYNFHNVPTGTVQTIGAQPLLPFRSDNWPIDVKF